MTFLPIVHRELLVGARRGTTHWARFTLTLVVSLITLNYFLGSGDVNPGQIGRSAFTWLLGAGFVLACAGCELTADALSAERREGTLGLLFLTDLRPWDVTLGKLASAGLGAAYGGIAFVPLLMLPLLAGGVSGGEAARSGLALLAILLFALAAGLAASAGETDRLRALRQAALGVLGTAILPLLVSFPFGSSPGSLLGLASPLTTLRRAGDAAYGTGPGLFWISLSLQLLLATFLLFSAGVSLRKSLSEETIRAPTSEPYSVDPVSNASYAVFNPRPKLCPRWPFDDTRPVEWLVQHQRGQQTLCWIAVLPAIVPRFLFWLFPLSLTRMAVSGAVSQPFFFLMPLAWLGHALLAWAAGRFFFEARRSGELELLLTTPLGAQDAVSAHWAAMKRLLLRPVVLMSAPVVFHFTSFFLFPAPPARGFPANMMLYSNLSAVLQLGALLLQIAAVNWLGMYFGLTARRQISAVAIPCALAVGLPMVIQFALHPASSVFGRMTVGEVGWIIWNLMFWAVDYALLLALTLWARQRLRHRLLTEPRRFDWRHDAKQALSQLAALIRAARQWKSG